MSQSNLEQVQQLAHGLKTTVDYLLGLSDDLLSDDDPRVASKQAQYVLKVYDLLPPEERAILLAAAEAMAAKPAGGNEMMSGDADPAMFAIRRGFAGRGWKQRIGPMRRWCT